MKTQEIQDLINITSRLVGVDISIPQTSRRQEYVLGKYLVIYTLVENGIVLKKDIHKVFRNDRTTCLHAINTIQNRIDSEKHFEYMCRDVLHYFREKEVNEEFKKVDMIEMEVMVLVDLLDSRMKKYPIHAILNPEEKSKWRNLYKSLGFFVEYTDKKIKNEDQIEEFTALCESFKIVR